MATVTTSKRYTLNIRDFLRGLLIAVVSAVLTALLTMLEAEDFVIQWKKMAIAGATAGVAYLLKNLFSPSEIVVTNAPATTVEAVKQGEAQVVVKPT